MKKKLLRLLVTLPLLAGIAGCDVTTDTSNSSQINLSESIAQSEELSTSSLINDSSIDLSSYDSSGVNISSGGSPRGTVDVQIFNINDLHGGLTSDYGGVAKLGGYIRDEEELNSNAISIKIANGDMFQGTALSNYSKGRVVVDVLNAMNFDEFTIGNHEFDWGIDIISDYSDGNLDNGEANFPFLGANIIEKATGKIAPYANEYVIIEERGVKIGIIGVIGKGLESSITASRVNAYQFLDPVPVVRDVSQKLHDEENVDIVVVANHNGGTSADVSENTRMVELSGNQRVDVIINGHTHQAYAQTLTSSSGRVIPVIQSGANGEMVGNLKFTYDLDAHNLSNINMKNVAASSMSNNLDLNVKAIIDAEVEATAPIFQRQIGILGERTNRSMLATWESNVMKQALSVDVGMVNNGGIRSYSYYQNTQITVETMIKIMPFDNAVMKVDLTGQQVKNICNNYSDLATSTNLSCSNYTIDNIAISNQQIYTVAAIDYIFEKEYLDFMRGENIIVTGVLVRDLMIADVEASTAVQTYWYPSNTPVHISPVDY